MSKNTLLEMLRYCRPDNSKGEKMFIRRFLLDLPGMTVDKYGNLILRIGDAPILWSSHTDTVHWQHSKQKVEVSKDGWITSNGDCLGADCGTGVYVMREMILRNVEGLYIFHRAEESGGRGSSYIATQTPEVLGGIKYAVALDRKGAGSVITHQFGGRCASDAFGNSLIDQLGMGWELDDGGTFTDTANYTDLVGECTNLSVGYLNQHSKTEKQLLAYALAMPELLANVDVGKLEFARQPGEQDPDDYTRYYHSFNGGTYNYGNNSSKVTHISEYDWMDDPQGRVWRKLTPGEIKGRKLAKLVNAMEMYPFSAAELLYQHGFSAIDIQDTAYSQAVDRELEKKFRLKEGEDEEVEDTRTSAY